MASSDPKFTNPSQNPSSPFYIHPSESPSSMIVTPTLYIHNYQSRSRHLSALVSKTKMSFLIRSITKPLPFDPLYYMRRIGRFSFYTLCSCLAKTFHQQDFIIRFLKDLDKHFSMVRSQILFLDPLPSANHVFPMIIQHERQHTTSTSIDSNPFINATAAKAHGFLQSRGPKNIASDKKCEHCRRLGHTIDAYYQKNGIFAPKWDYCRSFKHTMDVCYAKYGYPPSHPKYPG
uniref:Uncharacterized protein n=1 Tax=Cajanus cajan TaxID=3821 RepID=A0A151TPB3_CAJCA|nr:hypothetical protein KK1_022520 [Cajanus cajan]